MAILNGKKLLCLSLAVLTGLIISSGLTACKNTDDDEHKNQTTQGLTLIQNEAERNNVYNFNLEYELIVPGSQLSYYIMWTGYDLNNKFGPSVSMNNRFFTYLTDYSSDESFYLVYMNESIIDEATGWIAEYKKNYSNNNNCSFSEDKNVIDGKYLLYAQKNDKHDFVVYRTDDASDIKFTLEEMQLVMCLKAKTLKIEKNVSTGKSINRSVVLLNRTELLFDETTQSFAPYSFVSSFEQIAVSFCNNIFDYKGKRIEAYPESFEESNFLYCPSVGLAGTRYLKTVRADVSDGKVMLPRYIEEETQRIDLLDTNADLSIYEDVYKDLKSRFLDAYIGVADYPDSIYEYGLFDYDKVEKIIGSYRVD